MGDVLQCIKLDDHEAAIRLAIDRATKVAEADFFTRLAWRCGANGMADTDQYETFDGLLAAFEKHLLKGGNHMTNYTELADRVAKFQDFNRGILLDETIDILKDCESALRSVPEPVPATPTNYTELADLVARYIAGVPSGYEGLLDLLKDVEEALRFRTEDETPVAVRWLAADAYGEKGVDLYLYENDPTLDGRRFDFYGDCEGIERETKNVFPDLQPGQKCRVTFGPIIDCNPPKESEKSLGQVLWETERNSEFSWSELPHVMRESFDKRAAAIVAEHERRKAR